MRHIKSYKLFESIHSKFKENFGISIDEIRDLLVDVEDDFPDIDYWIDDAESSRLVKPDNQNIFVIYFGSDKPVWERENLYDLEHFLNKGKFNQIRSYLRDYGLEFFATDFGESDTEYEIVVCKKGTIVTTTQFYKDRYFGSDSVM